MSGTKRLIALNVSCSEVKLSGKSVDHFITLVKCFLPLPFYQAFLNKFQRAKDAMEYARKSAAESATATVSHQAQTPVVKVPKTLYSNTKFVSILSCVSDSESPNSKLKNKLVCIHPGTLDSHSRQFKFS